MTVPELEEFFKAVTLPEKIVIDKGTTIVDVKFFVESHLRVIRNQPDGKATQPFIDRLIKVKELLSQTNL